MKCFFIFLTFLSSLNVFAADTHIDPYADLKKELTDLNTVFTPYEKKAGLSYRDQDSLCKKIDTLYSNIMKDNTKAPLFLMAQRYYAEWVQSEIDKRQVYKNPNKFTPDLLDYNKIQSKYHLSTEQFSALQEELRKMPLSQFLELASLGFQNKSCHLSEGRIGADLSREIKTYFLTLDKWKRSNKTAFPQQGHSVK